MIEVQPPLERAILVGAPRKGSPDARKLEEHLHELAELVDTAGAEIVGRLTQQVPKQDAATLIGEGKVAELRDLVAERKATLVVFDEELTPNQGATLEHELRARVMDRAEVILDIFATRARSHEARLQVELAQMEYLLPRLARMWTHLSRIRGGIGLRGPGETQIETDRRMIRRKIQLLRHKLQDVARHRETVRAGRAPILAAALVGYTNAGKSSLLRALSGDHDVFVEDRLFATLDTTTREVDLGEGLRARVTDTVGFIRKLPHHLVASFRATLEEAGEADVLLHVVDASHPEWEDQVEVVRGVLAELGLDARPELLVFNKVDLLADPAAFAARVRELHPGCVTSSTVRIDGVVALRAALRERARAGQVVVTLRLSPGDGRLLARCYAEGEVLARRDGAGGVEVDVRLEGWRAERLAEAGAVLVARAGSVAGAADRGEAGRPRGRVDVWS